MKFNTKFFDRVLDLFFKQIIQRFKLVPFIEVKNEQTS